MKDIKKNPEPKSLVEYRNRLKKQNIKTNEYSRSTFDDCDKKKLRKSLLEEQGYICCYCMQSVKEENSRIEHFLPVSSSPKNILNYQNLFIACCGVSSVSENKSCHCDKKKVNKCLTINPLDCEKYITGYTSNGEIKYKDSVKKDIEETLNLNNDILKRNRKKAVSVVVNQFNKKLLWKNKDINEKIMNYKNKGRNGEYKAYCQSIIFFLEKRLSRN